MASRHMMSYVLRMLTRCRTEGVRKHARRVLLLLLHAAGLITYMQMMTHTLAIPPAPLLLQSSTSTCDVSAAQLLRFRECCWCCCCCHHFCCCLQAPGSSRDLLLLDIALESWLRMLVERQVGGLATALAAKP